MLGWIPSVARRAVGLDAEVHRHEIVVVRGVVVHGQRQLLHVVAAGHTRCGFAHLLHGWQEQADQDGDNRNHHEKLNECKSSALSQRHRGEGHGTPVKTKMVGCTILSCRRQRVKQSLKKFDCFNLMFNEVEDSTPTYTSFLL